MAVYYSHPQLKNLSQWSRIAFIRQVRRMSQQVFGEKIGLNKTHARTLVCRYEVHDRDIKPDRLDKIAEVLNVNKKMIERWDFHDPEQLYCELLWIEELCPDLFYRYTRTANPINETHRVLGTKYAEWREMKTKYLKEYITYEKYLDWKLGKYNGSCKEDEQ